MHDMQKYIDEAQEDEDQMDVLDQDICNKLCSVKRTLLPFLDEASNVSPVIDVPTVDPVKKSKWGPTVATRSSQRNHEHVSIVKKAKEY